jgi:hypothetical protein
MIGRPSSCRRLHPLEAHLGQIQRIDKHVDNANAETRRLPLGLVRTGVGAECVTRLKTLLSRPSPRCRDQPPLGLPPTKPPRLFGPGSL